MKPKKRLKYIASYWSELEDLTKKRNETKSTLLRGVMYFRIVVIRVKIQQFLDNKIDSNF